MHNYVKIVVVIFFLILSGCTTDDVSVSDKEVIVSKQKGIISQEVLLHDFDQLVEIIKNSPTKAFTDMSKFTDIADTQRLKISDMSRYEFYKVLAPVVASVDCGHTWIKYPVAYSKDEKYYFPFAVKVIDSDIYIFKNSYNTNIPEGSKILSINNRESADIISHLYSTIPSDGSNVTLKQYKLNQSFSKYYHDYFEAPKQFIITYTSPGETKVITEIIDANISSFRMEKATDADNYIVTESYAVLKAKSFKYLSSSTIESFFTTLNQKGTKNLILDLRGNTGGYPELANNLLSYLMNESFYFASKDQVGFDHLVLEKTPLNENAFKGELYIIANGGSFSATGFVLSHLKNRTNVTIVGQESGGGYVCTGYSEKVRLTNTQISLTNSQVLFATSVDHLELGRGVMPDIEINYTIDDYLLGKDLELETIIEMISTI